MMYLRLFLGGAEQPSGHACCTSISPRNEGACNPSGDGGCGLHAGRDGAKSVAGRVDTAFGSIGASSSVRNRRREGRWGNHVRRWRVDVTEGDIFVTVRSVR